MNLFENIYYDLLLEGKSPEEILAILKYKFKDVPENVIESVFKLDPTKKKSYTQWVLLHWKNEKHLVDSALKTGKLRELFEYLQKTPDAQLTKYDTLEEALYLVSNIDLLDKDGDGPENDFDIVYKSPEWVIAVPNTYAASHKLGENTDWCTAGYKYRDGEGYYNNYLRQYGGQYFINFDLRSSEHLNGIDYPFKRYQFHFESHQFMDAKDVPVSYDEIDDMPDNVAKFYEDKGYNFNDMNREEREERYQEARYDDGVCISYNNRLWLLQEYDHDNLELNEGNPTYMIYDVDTDDIDPIIYESVEKEPLYINDGAEIYILNTKYNDKTDYNQDLKLYKSTEMECIPIIIQKGTYGNYDVVDDISYYQVFETWGKESVAYVTSTVSYSHDSKVYATVEHDYLEFGLVGDYNVETALPFKPGLQVSDMKINYDVQALYGEMESDFLIEVIWENGYHSLFNIDRNNYCEIVIKGDKPVNNEELFTLGKDDEGEWVILGTFRNYDGSDLTYEKEDNNNFVSYMDKELFYKDMVSVVMTNKKYNVFNREKGKVVFDENFDSFNVDDANREYVEKLGVIIGKKNDKYAFYSLDTGEKLTDDFTLIDTFKNRHYFGACNGKPKTTNEFYIINYKLQVFGPFYKLTSEGTNNKVVVVIRDKNGMDGGKRVLNLNTGEIENSNLSRLTFLTNKSGYPVMLAQNENGEIICYNYETNQLIDRDIMVNRKPGFFRNDKGLDDYVVFRHSSTGKENIVSLKDGSKLLPNDVDMISTNDNFNDYDTRHVTLGHFVALKDGNTEYLLDLEKNTLLPTSDGITTGETTGIWNYRVVPNGPWAMFTIHDNKLSPEIYVTYNYYTNKVFATLNPASELNKPLKICEPEVQQRVMQAVYPQKAHVINTYNEMIKRMKDLIR